MSGGLFHSMFDDGGEAQTRSGILTTPRSIRMWHVLRVIGAGSLLFVTFSLGLMWDWEGALLVSLLSALPLIDASLRRHRQWVGLTIPVLIDISLIGMALMLIDLEAAGIRAPYVYMMAMPALLLPLRKALPMMAFGTLLAAFALFNDSPFGMPAAVDRAVITWISFTIFTGLLLAMLGVTGVNVSRVNAAVAASLRGESTVASAGRELLTRVEEEALLEALAALRQGLGGATSFVAENSGDRGSGPAALVSQVTAGDDGDETSIHWKLPYLQHREAAGALARGHAVRLDAPVATAMSRAPGTIHAMAVPVSVHGEWAGFLGVGYDLADDPEPDVPLTVLETVAAMVGSFMEKREAYHKLEESIQSRDQFLASVSHEIRTPLTSVLGFTSLLRESRGQLGEDESLEIVGLIQQQAQEVADLVEDLLVAARAEIDAVTVTIEPVELAEQIREVLQGRLGTEAKDIFVAASADHVAMADPTRVRQIVRNLVTNALRYGGDEITITTHRDGGEVSLVFSDNGDGIPPEMAVQVFDPYHRGEAGVIKAESVGLGLAVSRQLARLMDGDLVLRTDLGPATFQLTLPAVAPAPAEEEDASGQVALTG